MRIKEHPAKPMTIDDALYEMELVGHDFFLFQTRRATGLRWSTGGTPNYGLIRLA